jgi:hypothetical protein
MQQRFEPAPPAGRLTREQTKAAFERFHLLAKGDHAGGDWERMGEMYAEEATYFDAFYGWIHGRQAITRWLSESMKGLEKWSYPVQWVAIDEGRVVVHWLNRLPGHRPDGSYYEFPGISAITYGDDGLVVRQLDLYDVVETLQTVAEASTGPLGRGTRRVLATVAPVLRESARAFYRLFDRRK